MLPEWIQDLRKRQSTVVGANTLLPLALNLVSRVQGID